MSHDRKDGSNMTLEKDFQKTVIKWLKSKGCIVLKYQQNATTIVGVSDVFFCKEGFYGFIECKKAKNSSLRPGQQAFINKVNEWSYGKIVWPGDCWEKTKKELEQMLR